MKRPLLPAAILGLVALAYLGGVAGDEGGLIGFPPPSGDVNQDYGIDVSDAVYLLEYLFRGGPPPPPVGCEPFAAFHNGDVNGDGRLDISDPVYLLFYLFRGGDPPVEACPRGL